MKSRLVLVQIVQYGDGHFWSVKCKPCRKKKKELHFRFNFPQNWILYMQMEFMQVHFILLVLALPHFFEAYLYVYALIFISLSHLNQSSRYLYRKAIGNTAYFLFHQFF